MDFVLYNLKLNIWTISGGPLKYRITKIPYIGMWTGF